MLGTGELSTVAFVLAAAVILAPWCYVVGVLLERQLVWRSWLRDVPGPPRETFFMGNFPEFGRRDVVRVCLNWMQQYGGAVRFWAAIGEPRLLLSDVVALDHVLCKRVYAYPKVRLAARTLGGLMGNGIIVAEGEVHHRQKAAIQPGFSTRSIRNLSPIFAFHAQHLRDVFGKMTRGGAVETNVHALLSAAALDALGEAAFGLDFGALAAARRGDNGNVHSTHPLPAAFERALAMATNTTKLSNIFDAFTMIFPILEKLPFGVNSPAFRREMSVLHRASSEVVEQTKADVVREESEEIGEKAAPGADVEEGCHPRHREQRNRSHSRPDLLASLLRANRNAQRGAGEKHSVLDRATLTDDELVGQVSTFIFAGHETTATQLTWLLWMLAEHQEVQKQLRSEIRAARANLGLNAVPQACDADDPANRELELEEYSAIEYLDWCVRESLRLHGAIHTTSRIAQEPDVIPCSDGRRIMVQKGTLVLIPLSSISQDPALWGNDAHVFRPERWAEPLPGAKVFPRFGGLSFLQGPRACVGRTFAQAEMKSFLCVLLSAFEFHSAGRRIIPKRWLVSRPFEPGTRRDGCTLQVRALNEGM